MPESNQDNQSTINSQVGDSSQQEYANTSTEKVWARAEQIDWLMH